MAPGNYTGLSGDITNNKTDIGFAGIFNKLEKMKYMDYTYPYRRERICYMVEHWLKQTVLKIEHFCCILFRNYTANVTGESLVLNKNFPSIKQVFFQH